jgi:hypothetical protein
MEMWWGTKRVLEYDVFVVAREIMSVYVMDVSLLVCVLEKTIPVVFQIEIQGVRKIRVWGDDDGWLFFFVVSVERWISIGRMKGILLFIYWPATTYICLHENSLLRAFLAFEVVKEIILIFNRQTTIVRRSALGSLWLQSRAIPATHLRTCNLKAFFPSSHQTSNEQHAEKCRST